MATRHSLYPQVTDPVPRVDQSHVMSGMSQRPPLKQVCDYPDSDLLIC